MDPNAPDTPTSPPTTQHEGQPALLEVPLTALEPAGYNPRKISETQMDRLCQGIETFGMVEPIVINVRDGVPYRIVGGHQRVAACKRLGRLTVPAMAVDLERDGSDEKALNVALNKVGGEFDIPLLVTLLQELQLDTALDFTLTGFDSNDLENMLASLESDDPETTVLPATGDEDDTPEIPYATISVAGDLWLLGDHRLLCGDAGNITDVERLMDGAMADLVWTDPPYGVDNAGKNAHLNKQLGGNRIERDMESDDLDEDDLESLLQTALGNAMIVCRPGAAWYVTSPPGPLSRLFGNVLAQLNVWRQTLIWVKQHFALGRSDFHYRHEPMFYGWKDGAGHYFIDDRSQDSVWEFDKPAKNGNHPTTKPVELVVRAIRNSTKPGDIVLDVFAGSGTTLIAAHQTKRKAYVCEIDPRYCDVIVARWEKYTAHKAVRST